MALECPSSQDVQEIQFKLHDKLTLFNYGGGMRSHVHLLAAASSQGLLFAGNPNAPELKVMMLKEIADAKATGSQHRARSVPLPNVANTIACSADGSMLAVNYTLNGSGFVHIYSVPSFTTPQIISLYNIRISPEEGVFVVQLLWNPVLTNNLAAVLSNGALGIYTLKDGGNIEMRTLDKAQQVRSGCWSPKGKQIVLGFPNGKLQQFKPDLTLAKTITCLPNVHPGPFNTIALHWLSTFQFAVVFLQQGEEVAPSLYIVNAPKGGTSSYINYYDICYSATGPRQHQLTFTHIQPWNLLLVTSANGVEVGLLGTNQSGDTPTWVQYTLLDEARIEMPLTEGKEETYPIGFALDTSSSHHLTIAEKQMPVMPMVHVLSTHGDLVAFNFLNLSAGAIDLCSPPPPVMDSSGEFRSLADFSSSIAESKTQEAEITTPATMAAGDTSFSFAPNTMTSTPTMKAKTTPQVSAPQQAANLFTQTTAAAFAAPTSKATTTAFGTVSNTLQFGAAPTPAVSVPANFPGFGNNSSFSAFSGKLADSTAPTLDALGAPPPQPQQKLVLSSAPNVGELNKPLYTVPPIFTPPVPVSSTATVPTQKGSTLPADITKTRMNSGEIDEVVKQMIALQINAFDTELKQLRNQSKGLLGNIGSPEEVKAYTKRLNDLQEINEQANDRDFELDVQNLRHSLNETYAMLAECRTKLELYNNPDVTRLTSISTFDPINRRQLAKLQSYLATNQTQLQQLQQQIDAQWSNYQDLVRRNSKSKMHIPCLDGIYQRMTKLKDILARQRTKLNYIRAKLKQKGYTYKHPLGTDSAAASPSNETTMESLADSVLSMSLSHIVEANRSKLSPEKLNAIRNFARQQQEITIIRPHRPDRVGLKSEVILETKLQSDRKVRESVARAELVERQANKGAAVTPLTESVKQPSQLAKPTATKPIAAAVQPQSSFAPPTQMQMTTPSFNFGGTSPFVKTSAAQVGARAEESGIKPFVMAPSAGSSFGAPNFGGFGAGTAPGIVSFGQPKATTATAATKIDSALKEALAAPVAVQQTPISFSAKVIGGDAAATATLNKPFAATTTASGFAALSASNAPTNIVKPTPAPAADKENRKPDEIKPFSFSSAQEPATATTAAAPAFGGFTTTTKSSLFDGKSNLAGGASFSFGALGGATAPIFGAAAANANVAKPATGTITTPAAAFGFGGNTAFTASLPTAAVGAAANAGFGKAADELNTPTSAAATANSNTGTKVEGDALNLTVTSAAAVAPAVASTTAATTAAAMPTTSAPIPATVTSSTGDATDALFGSLNICKPTAKNGEGQGVFSGFGNSAGAFSFTAAAAGSDDSQNAAKSIFASSTTPAGSFTFSAAASGFGKPLVTPVATATSTATTAAATTATTAAAETTAASAPTSTSPSATAVSSTAPSSLFAGAAATANALFNAASSAATSTTDKTAAVVATSAAAAPVVSAAAASPIFGGGGSFLTATTATTAPNNSLPLFGSVTSPAAGTTAAAAPLFGAVTTAAAGSPLFAAAAATTATSPTTGNIFGGIPKPDASVFGSPTAAAAPQPVSSAGGLFAAAAAANPSPFGSPPAAGNAASGGSIFGGGASAFGATAGTGGGSIFGGSSPPATSPFGATASIFGGGAAKPAEGATNIFGSPTQAASGGSLFGQSAFGQSAQPAGGNLFGAAAAATQQTAGAGFGSGGSIFGGAASNNAATGGSIFGGASPAGGGSAFGAANTPATGGFGAFSQPAAAAPFGSPTNLGGSFAQGGNSVAQSGFGSPQQASAFAKPIFGGTAAFGSPPAFGAQPSFGGAPTFGSPKGFGTFAAPAPAAPSPGAFGAPAQQKNNLFEALGSTDSGLSFGNLAQASNANAQKPTFGGSSFMNYRA